MSGVCHLITIINLSLSCRREGCVWRVSPPLALLPGVGGTHHVRGERHVSVGPRETPAHPHHRRRQPTQNPPCVRNTGLCD